MTKSVPLETRDEVAVRVPNVAVPPVREEIVAVIALKRVVKMLEEVAFVLLMLLIIAKPLFKVLIVPVVP